MAVREPTQRRFATMGLNVFNIANQLMQNQRICRLLKYQVRDPFSNKYPDVDGVDLINKQILIVPKIYDESTEKTSYLTAIVDNFSLDIMNSEFKYSIVRFDIACPFEEWVLDEHSLRPYLLMQEIDTMFNEGKIAGIGTMQFMRAYSLVLTPWLGGYSMEYKFNEFN